MYQYNKSRARATLSPKEGPFFGPQFSLQASATTVNERPQNKQGGFVGSREAVPVKGQEVFSLSSPVPKRSSTVQRFGSESPSFSQSPASTAAKSSFNFENAPFPGDRVVFADNPNNPGVPIVYRSPEERTANPDRLNLDRRRLTVCPIIEGEEQLRLLNYQHNFISRVEHLSGLRRLIFLDLYDNHIDEISGLNSLKSLRVLMLGKNRIKKIENLDALLKLDVLDLHGNQIRDVENLNHLTELRVLNLAGNQIEQVDNLAGLSSIKEINLRRNRISTLCDIDSLPNLEKLFLSFNEISSFEDISCLQECSTLTELSLDGNPLCQEASYKQTLLSQLQQLRQLDMKRVGDDERRIATVMARKDEEKKKESDKLMMMKEKRKTAINNARRQWELMQGSLMMRTSRLLPQPMPDLVANHVANIPNKQFLDDGSESSRSSSTGKYRPLSGTTVSTISSRPQSGQTSRPTSAKSLQSEKEQRPTSGRPSSTGTTISRPTEKPATIRYSGEKETQSYYTEIEGETLCLYGTGSLESLDKPWGMSSAGAITTISFKFIDFDDIIKHLHKIRARFPSVHTLCFNSTNIRSMVQFSALSSLRRLDNITIESDGNPVTDFLLWKHYLLFRLAHFSLKKINDVDVSTTDIVNAEKFFGSLAHITTSQLPQTRLVSLIGENKRKQLTAQADDKRKSPETKTLTDQRSSTESVGRAGLVYTSPDLLQQKTHEQKMRKSFVHSYMAELSREAVMVDHKRSALDKIWQQVFAEMVYTCVSNMWDRKAYMKSCMDELMQDKS